MGKAKRLHRSAVLAGKEKPFAPLPPGKARKEAKAKEQARLRGTVK